MDFKRKNRSSLILAALLIVFFSSFLLLFIVATPNNRAMKCNDPGINKPARKGFWNNLIIAMVMPFFCPLFEISFSPYVKNVLHTILIYLTGFFATCFLVLSMIYYYGSLAPDFIASCQPDKLQELCDFNSNMYVFVNCTTPWTVWLPARSAFPSFLPAIQTFAILYLAFCVSDFLEMKCKRKLTFTFFHIIFLIVIGLTVWINVVNNNAHHSGAWVGCLIGILTAIGTRVVMKRVNSLELPELPQYWDDPTPNTKQGIFSADMPLPKLHPPPVSDTYVAPLLYPLQELNEKKKGKASTLRPFSAS